MQLEGIVKFLVNQAMLDWALVSIVLSVFAHMLPCFALSDFNLWTVCIRLWGWEHELGRDSLMIHIRMCCIGPTTPIFLLLEVSLDSSVGCAYMQTSLWGKGRQFNLHLSTEWGKFQSVVYILAYPPIVWDGERVSQPKKVTFKSFLYAPCRQGSTLSSSLWDPDNGKPKPISNQFTGKEASIFGSTPGPLCGAPGVLIGILWLCQFEFVGWMCPCGDATCRTIQWMVHMTWCLHIMENCYSFWNLTCWTFPDCGRTRRADSKLFMQLLPAKTILCGEASPDVLGILPNQSRPVKVFHHAPASWWCVQLLNLVRSLPLSRSTLAMWVHLHCSAGSQQKPIRA